MDRLRTDLLAIAAPIPHDRKSLVVPGDPKAKHGTAFAEDLLVRVGSQVGSPVRKVSSRGRRVRARFCRFLGRIRFRSATATESGAFRPHLLHLRPYLWF